MNLLYDDFPESIEVNGKTLNILTDFRDWIMFSDMMFDKNLSNADKLVGAKRWIEDDIPQSISISNIFQALVEFFSCSDMTEKNPATIEGSNKTSKPIFSYKHDAKYILSAFREVYHINLKTLEYMHWWEFQCLFESLPDTCELKKIMGYRNINLAEIKDSKERARIGKIQRCIALPTQMEDKDIGDIFSGVM